MIRSSGSLVVTTNRDITMYGADWCGDCLRAKAWFEEHGVDYDYVNLEQHPEAADIVLERNNGLKRIPVIVFGDDTHLTEPSNEALAAKMAQLAADDGSDAEPTFEVVEDPERGRFELRRDGEAVGHADYRSRGDSVLVPHVTTYAEHRGQGYADRLMEGLLDRLRDTDRTIVPLCPFAAGYVRDNERYHELLAARD